MNRKRRVYSTGRKMPWYATSRMVSPVGEVEMRPRPEEGTSEPMPESEQTSAKTTWKEEFRNLFKSLAVAGLKFVAAEEAPILRRMIWTASILCGIGFMLFQISSQTMRYFDYPQTVNIYLNATPLVKGGLRFPLVTICNENMLHKDRSRKTLLKRGRNQAEIEAVEKILGFLYRSPIVRHKHLRTSWKGIDVSFMQAMAKNRTEYLHTLTKMGHDKEDTIIGCIWQGTWCGQIGGVMGNTSFVADYFKDIITDAGPCFQFDPGAEFRMTRSSGLRLGLQLLMFTDAKNYAVPRSNSAGFKVFMHEDDDVPEMESLAFKVPPGFHTVVDVKRTTRRVLRPPHDSCAHRPLKYYDSYTLSRCRTECLTNHSVKHCGCVDFYMPQAWEMVCPNNVSATCKTALVNRTYPICDPRQVGVCLVDALAQYLTENAVAKCGCPVACEHTIYSPFISASTTSEFNTELMKQTFTPELTELLTKGYDNIHEFIKMEIVVLNIYFSDLSYEIITAQPAYTALALFCKIGGAMSLILGSTFLTLLEVFDFFALQAWKRIRD